MQTELLVLDPNPSINAPDAKEPAKQTVTVLQVLPRLVTGGVERGTVEIAQAITQAGWRAIVASEGGPMVREVERAGGVHITLPLNTRNPLLIRRNAARLAEVIRAEGVSLVHARSRGPAFSARAAARTCGVPFVTTFHGTYNLGPLGLKRRYNAVMASGERVIAISDFIARHMMTEYGADPARIRVIPRGVDFARFDPDKVSAERMIQLATRWRLADGEPVIMLPGRLTRWKGQLLLIEALAQLKDLRFRALLVGSDQGRTGYRAELEDAIRAAGLTDRVLVAGDCSDMPAAYMVTDVVVSASTDPEAFGRVSAEGQAMGRPVVAPRHGAAPEIVRDGESGWLFVPGNAASLAQVLRQALTLAPAERHAMAERGMAAMRASFSTEAMQARTLAVYREVLGLEDPAGA